MGITFQGLTEWNRETRSSNSLLLISRRSVQRFPSNGMYSMNHMHTGNPGSW